MDYYSVTIIMICVVHDEVDDREFTIDRQVYLVQAQSFDDAFEQGLELGEAETSEYQNDEGHLVTWECKEVETIRKMGQKFLGVELDSQLDEIYYSEEEFDGSCFPAGEAPDFEDHSDGASSKVKVSALIFGGTRWDEQQPMPLYEKRMLKTDADFNYYAEMYDDSTKCFDMCEQHQALVSSDHPSNVKEYRLYASYEKWGSIQEHERLYTVVLSKV